MPLFRSSSDAVRQSPLSKPTLWITLFSLVFVSKFRCVKIQCFVLIARLFRVLIRLSFVTFGASTELVFRLVFSLSSCVSRHTQ